MPQTQHSISFPQGSSNVGLQMHLSTFCNLTTSLTTQKTPVLFYLVLKERKRVPRNSFAFRRRRTDSGTVISSFGGSQLYRWPRGYDVLLSEYLGVWFGVRGRFVDYLTRSGWCRGRTRLPKPSISHHFTYISETGKKGLSQPIQVLTREATGILLMHPVAFELSAHTRTIDSSSVGSVM